MPQRNLESLGNARVNLEAVFGDLAGDLSKAKTQLQNSLDTIGGSLKQAGKGLTAGLTLPIAAAGAALLKIGTDYDNATKIIRAGTGATGDALAGLRADFKAIASTVPQDLSQVAQATADLNTRLGLTGKPLQNMARQMLDLARITKTDVGETVASATRVFGDWSIATENQSDKLDYLFKVSQSTGIGLGRLMGLIVQYGAPLRNLGIGFEEAAALMGKFEKEGVNVETVFGGLRQAVAKFANAGVDAKEGLKQTIDAIKNAASEAQGNTIAFEVFGRIAGPDMAAAIREGRFEIDDLVKGLKESTETIAKAGAETLTFGEKFAILRNKVTGALEPIGTKLLDIFDRQLFPLFEKAADWLARIADAFAGLDPGLQTAIIAFAGLAAAIGPLLTALGFMATGISAVLPLLTGAGGMVASATAVVAAMNPFVLVLGAAAAALVIYKDEVADAIVSTLEFFGVVESRSTQIEKLGGIAGGTAERLEALAASLNINVEALNRWQETNSKAISNLAANRQAVDALKASVEAGKISQAQYELELQKIATTGKSTTTATRQLAEATSGAGGAATKTGGKLDILNQVLAGTKKAGKGAAEELKRMVEAFEAAANPAAVLELELNALIAAGKNTDEIAKVYADRILDAAAANKRLHKELPPTVAQLYAQAGAAKLASAELQKLPISIKRGYADFEPLIKPAVKETVKLTDAQKELEKQLKAMRQAPVDLAEKIAYLKNQGLSAAEMAQLLSGDLDDASRAAELLGIELPEPIRQLIKLDKGAKASAEMARQWDNAWSTAMGNLVDRSIEAFNGWLFEGKKFSLKAGDLFKSLAKTLLGILETNLFTKMAAGFTGLLGMIPGIGGLFGGGGTFDWGSLFSLGGTTAAAGKGGGLAGGGGLIAGLAGLFGAGGGATIATQAGGALWLSGGTTALTGSAATAAGAGGGGGLLGSLGAFFTNPWTIGIGAALAGGFALYKWLKNPNKLGIKEIKRDFGVDVDQGTLKEVLKALGLHGYFEKVDRKSVLSSPQVFANLIRPIAEQTGQVEAVIAAFSRLQAFGQTWNFGEAVRQAFAGNFELFNTQFREVFGQLGSDIVNLMTVPTDANTRATAENTEAETGAAGSADQNTAATDANTEATQAASEAAADQAGASGSTGDALGLNTDALGKVNFTLETTNLNLDRLASGLDALAQKLGEYSEQMAAATTAEAALVADAQNLGGETNASLTVHINGVGDPDAVVAAIDSRVMPRFMEIIRTGQGGYREELSRQVTRTQAAL